MANPIPSSGLWAGSSSSSQMDPNLPSTPRVPPTLFATQGPSKRPCGKPNGSSISQFLRKREETGSRFSLTLNLNDKALQAEGVALFKKAKDLLRDLTKIDADCGYLKIDDALFSDEWENVLCLCSVEKGDSLHARFIAIHRIVVCSKIALLCEEFISIHRSKAQLRTERSGDPASEGSRDRGLSSQPIAEKIRLENTKTMRKLVPVYLTCLKNHPTFRDKDMVSKLFIDVLFSLYSTRDISLATEAAQRINEKHVEKRARNIYGKFSLPANTRVNWEYLGLDEAVAKKFAVLKKKIYACCVSDKKTNEERAILWEAINCVVVDMFKNK